jgi:hypothetical protein
MRGYDAGGGFATARDDTAVQQNAPGLSSVEHTMEWLSSETAASTGLPEDLSELRSQHEDRITSSQFTVLDLTKEIPLEASSSSESILKPDEPCCIELIQGAGLGKNVKVCDASPTGSVHVSNRNENRSNYYVNGMNQSTRRVVEDVQALTAVTGDSVRAILNDSSGSFFQEVKSAVLGFLSSILGQYAEPEAVESMMNVIIDDVREGKQVRVFAFSQGSIITSNALELLHDQLSEEEWKKLTENVEVITAGAGTNLFPDGIRAVGIVHEGDFVPHLTRSFSGIRSTASYAMSYLSGLKPTMLQAAPVIEIAGSDPEEPHRFTGYMEDLPAFLLAAHTNGDRVDGASLARAVAGAALNGDFADHVIHQVIGKMRDEQNVEFFEALRHYAPSGKIGMFPIGVRKTDEWEVSRAA